MAFGWIEYLEQARFLAQLHTGAVWDINFSEEAAYRSAVSRAYYAAFCYSRNYASEKLHFFPTKTPADHGKLREHFRKRGHLDVADSLGGLREWRNNCDYDDQVGDINQLVIDALNNATEVIEQLK